MKFNYYIKYFNNDTRNSIKEVKSTLSRYHTLQLGHLFSFSCDNYLVLFHFLFIFFFEGLYSQKIETLRTSKFKTRKIKNLSWKKKFPPLRKFYVDFYVEISGSESNLKFPEISGSYPIQKMKLLRNNLIYNSVLALDLSSSTL